MRRALILISLAGTFGCGASAPEEPVSQDSSGDEQASAAPRPEDVPEVGSAQLGLAGADEPDVVRYLMVRSAYAARLSPDGQTLAYRTSVTGAPQIWMREGEGAPQQRTFGEPITFHSYSPAGDQLIYGTDRGGNEREGFYLMTPDGTRERELLPPSDAFRSFGGFSRDGGRFAYATTPSQGTPSQGTPSQGTPSQVSGADDARGEDAYDIHVMQLESGADRRVYEGRLGLYVASWRPDGGALVIGETRGEDANDLHLLDLESGEMQTLFAPEDEPSQYHSIDWLPDSSGFYMVSDQGRDFTGIAFVEDGALRWRHTPDRDVEDLALSPDGSVLVWTENDGGFSRLYAQPRTAGGEITVPELPAGIYRVGFAERANVLAITISSPRIPGDIWLWNLDDNSVRRATQSTLAGLDPARLIEPTHETLEASDGVSIHGLLYLPEGASRAEPPPVVIDIHGGPTAQARPEFSATQQYLLARGIAIFDLNFRGSTGYGKAYARLDNGRLRPNAVRDLQDTLRWLESDARVDASRAAVMGASYGGYMVFAALTTYPTAFRGGVSFVGVSNWVTALEAASPELRASDRLEYGDIDDPDDRAFFEELSPITHIERIERPLLVSHGANDPRDPVSESDRFVIAARERGVEVDYVRFPDEGHGVRHLRNRVHLYRRTAHFLERLLAPE